MPDERIVLAYDPTEAIAGAAKANKAVEGNEKAVKKAAKAAADAAAKEAAAIVTITERSQNSINKIIASAERKAALTTASPAERLRMDRQSALSKVGSDSASVARLTQAYDKLEAAQARAATTGSKIADAIRNPMQAAGNAVQEMAAGLGKIGAIGLAAGAGIAFLAKAGFDLVAAQGRAAEAVTNFADTVGISATEAYKLDIQAKLVGSSLEGLTAGYKKLSQGIQEGSEEGKKSAAGLASLGVRIFDLNGKIRPFNELFGDLADRIKGIEEPSARAAKVVEILGKSGLSLIPLLKQFRETEEMARLAAAGIDDPLLTKLSEFDDKIGVLTARWDKLKTILAGKIVAVIEVVEKANQGGFSSFVGPGFSGADTSAQDIATKAAQQRADRMAEANRKVLADEGSALLAKFRAQAGQDDAGLKARLADVTERRKAAEQFGEGMGAVEVSKRIAEIKKLTVEEASLTAQIKARAKAEQESEQKRAEFAKATAKAREMMRQRAAGGFRVDEIKEFDAKPANAIFTDRFKAEQKLSEDVAAMQSGNIREQFAQEEIFAQTSRDRQLAAAEGFNARTVAEKLAVEERKAEIERQYLAATYAAKAALLQADQQLELAKAEENGALKAAINEKYALAGRELTLRTEAALTAATDNAAIRSGQLIADHNQKIFDSLKNAADGLFDALITRTKSFGDVLKNLLLQAVLTPLKQIASTSIANSLMGAGFGGANGSPRSSGSAGGIFSALGSLGGVARAGAPGGTPGFAGPVGGGPGGSMTGLLGSAKGSLTQLGQLGATNRMFSGGVYGAKGGAMLGGGAILAADGLRRGGLLGLAETTAGGALIGAKFGGPMGALIGAGIGAAAGAIRMLFKGAESKMVEKVKAVYGITIDRGFAKSTLLPIIKDQFGGDIDLGIRSPAVREMLSIYRMQSNQAGAGGAALGATNNMARGVSLSGNNGTVTQAPVTVNGASYGYGGTIESSAPSQPFVIENRIQIDGRDVQASVQRTNQASVGRRESSAVLTDPLLVFG